MIYECDYCGTEFDRRTTWQKFCSALCRLRANRKKQRELADTTQTQGGGE